MRPSFVSMILVVSLSVLGASCSRREADARGELLNVPTPTATVAAQPIIDVSMKQLLDNPKQYDSKPIRVVGFVYLEFEGNIISEGPDKRYSRPVRDVWLDVDSTVRNDHAKYHEKYVLVEGTFNSNHQGHMNLSTGTIENIKRFELATSKE